MIGIHRTDELMKLIVGNPVAIDAFRAGIPGNGKPFPDGSKMAKVEWRPKKSPDAPYDIDVPGAIYDLDFMVKDAQRFADSGGWGYAVFKQDAASAPTHPPTARTSHRRGMTPSVVPRATPLRGQKTMSSRSTRSGERVACKETLAVGAAEYLRRVISWLRTGVPRRGEQYLNGRSPCQ